MEAAGEDGVVRACGGLILRDGLVVVVHRPEVRRLVVSEGQGTPGRERRGVRAARDRRGNRAAGAARRGARDDDIRGCEGTAEARSVVADDAAHGRVHPDGRDRRTALADAGARRAACSPTRATSSCSTRSGARRRRAGRPAAARRPPGSRLATAQTEHRSGARPGRGSSLPQAGCGRGRHGARAPWRSRRQAARRGARRLARGRRRRIRDRRPVATARALPPVASASSGRGGSSSASPLWTTARADSISVAVGGSPGSSAAVRRSDPRSTDRTQAGPSSCVPTTSSVEPPPTSQTATTLSPVSARETAPSKARRPSSSADTTRTSPAVARPSTSSRRAGSSPWRPGAVTTVSSSRTPSLRAIRA